jgi:hypothetical protein
MFEEFPKGFMRGITPTVVQPFADWALNMDYAGRPIGREKNQFGRELPESARGFGKEGPVASWIAKELNQLTGGSTARSGTLSINPAGLDHVFEFFTGGVGKVLRQAFTLPFKLDDEAVYEPRNWPVVDRFLESKNTYWLNHRYYSLRAAVAETKADIADAVKNKDWALKAKLISERKPEHKMIEEFDRKGRELSDLYNDRSAVEASKTLTAQDKEARKDRIDANIKKIQLRMVTKYHEFYEEDRKKRQAQ